MYYTAGVIPFPFFLLVSLLKKLLFHCHTIAALGEMARLPLILALLYSTYLSPLVPVALRCVWRQFLWQHGGGIYRRRGAWSGQWAWRLDSITRPLFPRLSQSLSQSCSSRHLSECEEKGQDYSRSCTSAAPNDSGNPAHMIHRNNVCLMLGQRLRRWLNITQTSFRCIVLAGRAPGPG